MAAAAAVVLAGVLAPPAAAAPPWIETCSELAVDGRITDTVILTDFWVDVDCDLTDVHVKGWVEVSPGVSLTAERLVVERSLAVAGDTSLVASAVRGSVDLRPSGTPYAFSAETLTVRGDVVGSADTVSLRYARIDGGYDVATSTLVRLQSSTVTRDVIARGGRLVVHDTTFLDSFESVGNGDVLVCRVSVAGNLHVTGLTDYARLGVEGTLRCRSQVHGSVVLEDNPHSVDLGPLEIDGDLVCFGNTGPRGITGLHLAQPEGSRIGQCRI
ncbi:hypothetical protein AB6N24_15230 [Cellulomonas sp. 179-A 4D5 NHS]|uniref:hypothetical protein n=1 Tax=Cellulomonas sp. 179-A 4D5 NHS TaxID=3142378 RepID=UPI0039A2D943